MQEVLNNVVLSVESKVKSEKVSQLKKRVVGGSRKLLASWRNVAST
jgi:hypothetical protein